MIYGVEFTPVAATRTVEAAREQTPPGAVTEQLRRTRPLPFMLVAAAIAVTVYWFVRHTR